MSPSLPALAASKAASNDSCEAGAPDLCLFGSLPSPLSKAEAVRFAPLLSWLLAPALVNATSKISSSPPSSLFSRPTCSAPE